MTLMRWTPLSPNRDDVTRLFDSFFSRGVLGGDLPSTFAPAVDIEENAEAFLLRFDLPGISQKDVKVSLMGDTLTVRGERKSERNEKNGNYRRLERVSGSFERVFTLDSPVRADQIKAQYKDGVLEITVPKAEEAKLREIEVQVG
jgi:HSP20 family protein